MFNPGYELVLTEDIRVTNADPNLQIYKAGDTGTFVGMCGSGWEKSMGMADIKMNSTGRVIHVTPVYFTSIVR